MKNKQTFIVLDFETGSRDARTTEPLQLAAIPINPRTLEVDEKNVFQSYMKPYNFKALDPEALKVNNITVEMLEQAPDRSLVWQQFVQWISQFNPSGKFWTTPIMIGHNILGFDWVIYDRLCREFKNLDKDGNPNLFSTYLRLDTLPYMFFWFENSDDIQNYKLDTLREFFGFSKEGAHNAVTDVKQTAQLIARFMKFQRKLYETHGKNLKGSFAK